MNADQASRYCQLEDNAGYGNLPACIAAKTGTDPLGIVGSEGDTVYMYCDDTNSAIEDRLYAYMTGDGITITNNEKTAILNKNNCILVDDTHSSDTINIFTEYGNQSFSIKPDTAEQFKCYMDMGTRDDWIKRDDNGTIIDPDGGRWSQTDTLPSPFKCRGDPSTNACKQVPIPCDREIYGTSMEGLRKIGIVMKMKNFKTDKYRDLDRYNACLGPETACSGTYISGCELFNPDGDTCPTDMTRDTSSGTSTESSQQTGIVFF